MTTWDERMTARTPQAPRLEPVEVLWRMAGPSGRVLGCGVYRTDVGLEVRCGYGEHDLLRSQYAVEIGPARAIAEQWRQAVLAKGGFSHVGGDMEGEHVAPAASSAARRTPRMSTAIDSPGLDEDDE